MSYIFVSKYYPNIISQIIVALTCYILLYLIFIDPNGKCFNKYKYYLVIILMLEAFFIVMRLIKINQPNKIGASLHVEHMQNDSDKQKNIPNTSLDIHSTTLSSEINDYKIIHDTSSDLTEEETIFSIGAEDRI